MFRDYLRLSMKSLRRRSLRSWLTILGIVVGVAAVVALIAIGEGMQRSVEQQFDTIGYNTIILGEAAGRAIGTTTPATPSVPVGFPAGRGGAGDSESEEEPQSEEESKQPVEGRGEIGNRLQGLSPEEIEALMAQRQGGAMGGRLLEGLSPEEIEALIVRYQSEAKTDGEAIDLDTLRGELLAAAARGEIAAMDGARAYVSAGMQAGEYAPADAPGIMQQFMQEATAQIESGSEASPASGDVTTEPEGEGVDLDTLRGELLAAVARGEMAPMEGAITYVSAGVQAGEWTRAEAPSIMQQFVAEASGQGESSDEAAPAVREARGTTQTAVVADGMSSMEVLESLADLSMVAVTGAQRNETAMVTSEGLAGIGILRLIGMTPSMPEDFPLYFEGYDIAEGRAFTDEDLHVVVLGSGVAHDLVVGVGDEISIQGTPFEVIGILTEPEQVSGGFTVGETRFSLFVPIPALESVFGNQGAFSLAFLEVTDGTSIDIAVQQVRDTFAQAGKPISATTASELSAEIGAALSSVNLTLSAIAGISLLVGALGVMNTMYMSVLERTREIGIMKAVGAKDRDVLGLFLIESSLLGFIGGALGILLGVGISGLAGRLISGSLSLGTVNQVAESAGLQASGVAGLVPAFSASLIFMALGLSLVVGMLAGVLPAWRAAKFPPVKALRYE